MTKQQFIASVESKPQFIKWASVPVVAETLGDVEKWHGIAYITTPDGTNTYNVWFMVDTITGEAAWQSHDTMEPEKNLYNAKMAALTAYLGSHFEAWFLVPGHADLINDWAEAEVFTVNAGKLDRSKVLVYKKGSNPIAHIVINN